MRRPADDPQDEHAVEPAAPDPVEPPLGEGDDDPLILWFLSLTPAQRLRFAQGFVDSALQLRNGLRS